jgi:hypothetical protein
VLDAGGVPVFELEPRGNGVNIIEPMTGRRLGWVPVRVGDPPGEDDTGSVDLVG